MVEIPANHECTEWCFEEHASPPPTLVEQMLAAWDSGWESPESAMAAALAVVRAAVNDIPYEGADDRFDPVLELLGGGSDA
jgi:hypothetical protein